MEGLSLHSTFFGIFYLKKEKTAISLFFTTFYHWTMGGSASSQSTKDGDIENKKENNFGLVNVSSANSGTWNIIEIATCVFVVLGLLYLLSFWCKKRRDRRLARLTSALQANGLQGVAVQPDVARIPVIQPAYQEMHPRRPSIAVQPPPAYPTVSKEERLGAAMMEKYT